MAQYPDLDLLIPSGPGWEIPWEKILASPLGPVLRELESVPQNPRFHGEGDVLTHTKMVCQALCAMDEFRTLSESRRRTVFLAALLHDVGKLEKTRLEGGQWTSPNHASAGAQMARVLLWEDCDLAGTMEKMILRESICCLIRNHALPPHALDNPHPETRLLQVQANAELLPEFDLELLCLLAQADARGRICDDRREMEEQVLLCREFSRELVETELPFSTEFTRYARLSGRNVPAGVALYDDSWGEILLMSGLPGTGKDTWLAQNHPDKPQVCLDRIRAEHKIGFRDSQREVVDLAYEEAKEHLRRREEFVWNATSITPDVRRKIVHLCVSYGARVKIVYLETGLEENLRRNRGRAATVPESVIAHMRRRLTPPEICEAHRVEWLCI